MNEPRAQIALVGIGNPLAGDDGVGPEVLRRLQERRGQDARMRFVHLESDLFAVMDHLDLAEHFIFVDAMTGEAPGSIQVNRGYQRAFAASLHQVDLGSVMRSFENLHVVHPFPSWEVWGIVIPTPGEYRVGLSPGIERAASRLVDALDEHLCILLDDTHPSHEPTSFRRPA